MTTPTVAGTALTPPVCAIHQPNLFPRLSTLAKLFTADAWIVLDNVQFTRRDYQHRCRLADPSDPSDPSDPQRQQWLTLPVHLPNGRATRIHDVRLADQARSRRRVTQLLRHTYGQTPYWTAIEEPIRQVQETLAHTDHLIEIAETSTRALLRLLGWTGTIHHASRIPTRTGRSERLADLTCAIGATTYLCGTGGATYLSTWPFATHGLQVRLFPTPAECARHRPLHRVTALHALAGRGPQALAAELRDHASDLR